VAQQRRQPVLGGTRVVVEERDDLALTGRGAGVAGPGRAAGAGIGDDRAVGELAAGAGQQARIVVDDHHHLQHRRGLRANRLDRVAELIPAIIGEGSDDHGYGREPDTAVGDRAHPVPPS